MEPDDLLRSRNARPEKALVGRALLREGRLIQLFLEWGKGLDRRAHGESWQATPPLRGGKETEQRCAGTISKCLPLLPFGVEYAHELKGT